MRFYHLSDLHLGKSLHGVNLLESGDQSHWVEGFLALAARTAPDAVVIAGDVYDRSAPSAGAVELLDRLLTGLTAHGIAVLLIPGNHDSPQRLAFGRSLLERQRLFIAPPLTAPGRLSCVTLTDEYGPVDFWLMPYLFPALASAALGTELRDYGEAVRAILAAQALDPSRRNVVVAHQNVTAEGIEAERGGSESAVGGVGQVDFTVFDGFDYAALGHIHAGYHVGRSAVRYAGSPLCYHFNEARQAQKGPLLVTLGPKGTAPNIELTPLAPLHPLRCNAGSYEAVRADEAARTDGRDYVSITLSDRRITPEIAEDLRRLLEVRGSLLMELSSSFRAAAGAGSPSVSALQERSLAELFSDFYAHKNVSAGPGEAELALLIRASELAQTAELRLPPEEEQIDALVRAALREVKP